MMVSTTPGEALAAFVGAVIHPRGPRILLSWLLLSLVLGALVVLIVVTLYIGMGLSNRIGDLEQEMPLSADRLGEVDSQVVDALLELRVLSYWLAYPTDEPLVLEPPNGTGDSQGVLRISGDGLRGILMVASMEELPPGFVYQFWLTEDGRLRVPAAKFKVDPNGWGATTLLSG